MILNDVVMWDNSEMTIVWFWLALLRGLIFSTGCAFYLFDAFLTSVLKPFHFKVFVFLIFMHFRLLLNRGLPQWFASPYCFVTLLGLNLGICGASQLPDTSLVTARFSAFCLQTIYNSSSNSVDVQSPLESSPWRGIVGHEAAGVRGPMAHP